MQAIEMVLELLLDEGEIELVENKELPAVINQRNPFYLNVVYNRQEKRFECEMRYQVRDNSDQFVQINRMYTSELIGEIARLEGEELNDLGDTED